PPLWLSDSPDMVWIHIVVPHAAHLLLAAPALKGGKGGIGGTLLAVALLGALENGLTVQGINAFWQNVAQGALLVVAVVIQQRRNGERRIGLPA
ncbi:hypothetical protein ACFV4M_42025, partial [Kitasatospora indigofera]